MLYLSMQEQQTFLGLNVSGENGFKAKQNPYTLSRAAAQNALAVRTLCLLVLNSFAQHKHVFSFSHPY
jgi:hypothetical protein